MAPLLTTAEAATYLAVSPRTLEDWRTRLVGPVYIKPAGTSTIRYRSEDLEAWIDQSIQTGKP
jgi:hypothetical protein